MGTFLFILLFIAGTFIFFLAPKTIFDGNCRESKTSWISDLAAMNAQAERILCQEPCGCNFTNVNNTYTPQEVDLLKRMNTSSPIVNVMGCQAFLDLQFSEANYVLMGALEGELQCGGWCSDSPLGIFYYYTKISTDQRPTQTCYDAFKGFFEKNGVILGLGCSAALAFSLLNMVMICCLCFHPSKTGNRSDFYKRMVEDD